MNEERLYAEVRKRRGFSEAEWEYLRSKEYVQEAADRDFEEEAVQFLVHELDLLPSRTGSGRQKGDETHEETSDSSWRISEPFSVELSGAETERAKVLLEIQLREANAHPHVREFRSRYLSAGLLSPKEAEEFLRSPEVTELERLSSQLSRHYGWHSDDAAWWVLTSEAPPPRPVRGSFRWTKSIHGPDVHSIDLEAPPWISAETVKSAFQEMQRRVVRGTNKPLDDRTLRVLRFVEEQKGSLRADRPSYEMLLKRWNRQYPKERYRDYRSFSKAYRRAFQNVIRPLYATSLSREPTPNMQRQESRRRRKMEHLREVREHP
jgi:hypothetical protein